MFDIEEEWAKVSAELDEKKRTKLLFAFLFIFSFFGIVDLLVLRTVILAEAKDIVGGISMDDLLNGKFGDAVKQLILEQLEKAGKSPDDPEIRNLSLVKAGDGEEVDKEGEEATKEGDEEGEKDTEGEEKPKEEKKEEEEAKNSGQEASKEKKEGNNDEVNQPD
jgi:hypothetical protein